MDKTAKNSKWAACTLAAVLSVLCALPSCKGKKHRTARDTLVMVMESILRDLDPRFAITNHDVKLSRLVAPGLTTADTPDLRPELHLAESIEEIGDLHWRVKLKPGLRFSDGSAVTAKDVAFTYNSVLAEETGSLMRKAFLERYARVEAVSELATDFYLKKPVATLRSDLEFGIISAKVAGGDGPLLGAGPFAIESFAPEHTVLVRNEHYAGPGEAPRVRRIEVKTVRDGNARNLMLVGGSADFCQNAVRVDLVDFIAERERIQVVSGESAILTYLMMHNEDPILSDKRVRRAIALALDRKRIIDVKFGGRAVLATGLLPPFHWAYNGDVSRYEHAPAAAMKLLDEAGYPDPDGPGGEPRFQLSYKTSASQFRLAVARIIASQLREVGIEIVVQSFEFGTFFADVKAGNYQLASMQTSAISEPDFYFTYFHSSRIPSDDAPHVHNRWRYSNKRIDDLTMRGRSVMDSEQRVTLYREVQEILAEEVPIIPLWHENNIAVMNRSIQGFGVLPNARLAGFAALFKE